MFTKQTPPLLREAIQKLGSAAAVAKVVEKTPSTVYRWTKTGIVPAKSWDALQEIVDGPKLPAPPADAPTKRGRGRPRVTQSPAEVPADAPAEVNYKDTLLSLVPGLAKPRYLGEVAVDENGKSTGRDKYMVALMSGSSLVFIRLDYLGYGIHTDGQRVRIVSNPDKPVEPALDRVVRVEELQESLEALLAPLVERAVRMVVEPRLSELRNLLRLKVIRDSSKTATGGNCPTKENETDSARRQELPELAECSEEEFRAKEARHQDLLRKVGDTVANDTLRELLGLSVVNAVTLGGWNLNTKPSHIHPAGSIQVLEKKKYNLSGLLFTNSGAVNVTLLFPEGQADDVEKYLALFN